MPRSLRLAVLMSLLLASPAVAQEGKPGLLTLNTGLMVWTIFIFLIVLFFLYRFAYPHILGAVEAREQHIRELLAAAKQDREEARALLEEQQKQMEEVRARAQELVAEGRTAGERLREEIVSQARREQEALMERTRRDIQAETERALAEVRSQAVEVAIAAAGKLIERNLDEDDNRRLVREYLGRLEAGVPAVPVGV
ncbi:MAG TPA: F0F1 ATP synthase subunit B [Longimicrobiaceae bacterium]|nr:F0F1 ATP synthase subunit B [Longimicrobiaceae bacterium]